MFLVFALAAGLCGFGGIAGPTAWLAKALSVTLLALAAAAFAQRLTDGLQALPAEPSLPAEPARPGEPPDPNPPEPPGDRPLVE